jgi:hypothetical protein
MYQFSRAIYLRLADDILDDEVVPGISNHETVLRACEGAIERLATDRHYFAKPARTLFREIRIYFPMTAQPKACEVVRRYMDAATEYFSRLPQHGYDVNGNPLQCRATTRKGTACQRMPLPHNGYCPSHQHLAETEDVEAMPLAA